MSHLNTGASVRVEHDIQTKRDKFTAIAVNKLKMVFGPKKNWESGVQKLLDTFLMDLNKKDPYEALNHLTDSAHSISNVLVKRMSYRQSFNKVFSGKIVGKVKKGEIDPRTWFTLKGALFDFSRTLLGQVYLEWETSAPSLFHELFVERLDKIKEDEDPLKIFDAYRLLLSNMEMYDPARSDFSLALSKKSGDSGSATKSQKIVYDSGFDDDEDELNGLVFARGPMGRDLYYPKVIPDEELDSFVERNQLEFNLDGRDAFGYSLILLRTEELGSWAIYRSEPMYFLRVEMHRTNLSSASRFADRGKEVRLG